MVQEEAQVFSGPETKLGQDHSISVSMPFLCPSLAGEVAFDLKDRKQGTSARLGKDTKQQPWETQRPLFPFKLTPIQSPACRDPGKSNWPMIRLIKLYWRWLFENTTHKIESFTCDALQSRYLLIIPWVKSETYQIDEEVDVYLEKGQHNNKTVVLAEFIFNIHCIWLLASMCFDICIM